MKRKYIGFSLLEILVVLSIMLMLCALIFAAMGQTREKGRQGVCASNLHQYGVAFALYIQDYDGVEPQVGVPTTHAQLGLPPSSYCWDFLKQYKIYNTALMHCPSEHYLTPIHSMNSYWVDGWNGDDDPDYPHQVAQYGPELDLASCEMHNVDVNFMNQPTWATKWVQSIHMDYHITFRKVKAIGSTSWQ